MVTLAAVAAQRTVTEYVEPYDTIATVAILLLMLVYLTGLPATVAIAAMLWRQRTRSPRRPAYAAAVPQSAPPPPQSTAASSPSAAPVAGSPLLHLQKLEREVLALREELPPPAAWERLARQTADLASRPDPYAGRYAGGLRAIVAALAPLHSDEVTPAEPPDPPSPPTGELPDLLRVCLARFAAAGRPIPARWAFAWYGHLPDRWPPQADHRRREIGRSFLRRYQETYPRGGMIVALTGGALALRYTPVSARFGGRPIEIATDLPEVTGLPEVERRLRAVGAAALADIQPPVIPPVAPTGTTAPSS